MAASRDWLISVRIKCDTFNFVALRCDLFYARQLPEMILDVKTLNYESIVQIRVKILQRLLRSIHIEEIKSNLSKGKWFRSVNKLLCG